MRALAAVVLALCPGVASACAVCLDAGVGPRGFNAAYAGLLLAPFVVVAGIAGAVVWGYRRGSWRER